MSKGGSKNNATTTKRRRGKYSEYKKEAKVTSLGVTVSLSQI